MTKDEMCQYLEKNGWIRSDADDLFIRTYTLGELIRKEYTCIYDDEVTFRQYNERIIYVYIRGENYKLDNLWGREGMLYYSHNVDGHTWVDATPF